MWQTAPKRAYRQRIISTHTSRVGCDIAFNLVDEHTVISTHTSRVGCDNLWDTLERRGLISTHTSRVGCDAVEDWCLRRGAISTHTSRVGCDGEEWQFRSVSVDFYSHIPCGMWPIPEVSSTVSKAFLLTHPVWDVTSILLCLRSSGTFLLTHPVWDVTANTANNCIVQGISTHTSRVGCDESFSKTSYVRISISTHTSRVGCDGTLLDGYAVMPNFYSHIPCGMWLPNLLWLLFLLHFYSHIPGGMWRLFRSSVRTANMKFYSHIPGVMSLVLFVPANPLRRISTHTSRVGCDRYI